MFLDRSLTALKSVLELQAPASLLELRLVNCETNIKVMKSLMGFLGGGECKLRALALVQMKINFSLDELAHLVDTSEVLQELDLSNNECLPIHFAPLFKSLAYNKKLQQVNLSWNTLI